MEPGDFLTEYGWGRGISQAQPNADTLQQFRNCCRPSTEAAHISGFSSRKSHPSLLLKKVYVYSEYCSKSRWPVLGGEEIPIDEDVAEFAGVIVRLQHRFERRELGVLCLQCCGCDREQLCPMRPGAEGLQLRFDLRQDLLHLIPLRFPGEVDGEGITLIGHADPQIIGGDGAEVGLKKMWRDL